MLNGRRIAVVLPAYQAGRTLQRTIAEIDRAIVDDVIVVDDASTDETWAIAQRLPDIVAVRHERNRGYGGNQKTGFELALTRGADVIILLHPDYQYTPSLVVAMAAMMAYGTYDAVMASRILGRAPLKGGMPRYKYVANRLLTVVENLCLGMKLSEYHSGYRGYTRQVLERVPFQQNADDFVFDNQIIAQIILAGFRLGELACPTRYAEDSSSIGGWKAVKYGLGVLQTAVEYRLAQWQWYTPTYLQGVLPQNLSGRSAEDVSP